MSCDSHLNEVRIHCVVPLKKRDKLNTDPNLTPNPIQTHDRTPNPNRATSKKNFAPGGSRTRDPEAK